MPRCSCDPRSRMTASTAEAPLLGQRIPVAAFSRGAGVLGIAPPTPKSNASMRPQPKRPSKTMRTLIAATHGRPVQYSQNHAYRQKAPTPPPVPSSPRGRGLVEPYRLCLATVFSTLWLPGSDNLAKEPPMPQISAFPSIKALSILLLVPLNSTSLPWWTTLSIIAEASLSSPRIVPHLLNSMLVVNTTLRFS